MHFANVPAADWYQHCHVITILACCIRRAVYAVCICRYYAATIIQMGGINDKTVAIWLTAVVTAVNFICTFIGVYLVDRIGRRLLLLGSIIGIVRLIPHQLSLSIIVSFI